MTRYAVARKTDDWFPIHFQTICERTLCDECGNSEGLLALIDRLDQKDYDLINSIEELLKVIENKKRG